MCRYEKNQNVEVLSPTIIFCAYLGLVYISVDKKIKNQYFLFLHTSYVMREKKIQCEEVSCRNRNRLTRYQGYIKNIDSRALLFLDCLNRSQVENILYSFFVFFSTLYMRVKIFTYYAFTHLPRGNLLFYVNSHLLYIHVYRLWYLWLYWGGKLV